MLEQKVAVVIGATGMIGNLLTQRLLKHPGFSKVRVLIRRPLSYEHPRLEVQVVDFDDPNDIQSKLGTGDCIFSSIGTTQKAVDRDEALYWKIDHDIPVHTATLGMAAGFHTFLLVSSVRANAKSTNFYIQLKGLVEKDILAINYRSTHIFRPSLLMGKRAEKRFAEGIFQSIMKPLAPVMVGTLQKYRPVEAEDIAKAMIAAANMQEPGNHIYEYKEIMQLAKPFEPQRHEEHSQSPADRSASTGSFRQSDGEII
jgi:uncharacterized protein YbjT (DUF2867 family)